MTIRDLTQKKLRRSDSTESSSSEAMELSKPPKDVLELGRHLVRELGFEDGVDTLGRWMSHHVAELIDKAENGVTAAERVRARKLATETILKIWDHRASLPANTYPLAPYKDVLKVLDRLQSNNNPFRYINRYGETKRAQCTADLFDSLSRLIIALLLMEIPSGEGSVSVETPASEALSETEQQVLTAIQRWDELFEPTSESVGGTREQEASDNVRVNLDEAAIQLIDRITTTLTELRSKLQKSTDSL
jgi:hypothetical protein